jgi:hypothetical protein
MGDRSLVAFVMKTDRSDEPESIVYLYSHSGGFATFQEVATVLRLRQRWNQPSYLVRRCIAYALGDGALDEVGSGISLSPIAPDHPTFVVDTVRQRVFFVHAPSPDDVARWHGYAAAMQALILARVSESEGASFKELGAKRATIEEATLTIKPASRARRKRI